MSTDIKKFFHAKDNLESITTIVYMMAKNNFGIELDGSFTPKLFEVMEDILTKFGKKPKTISIETHIKNLNKLVIDDCLKVLSSQQSQQNQNSSQNIENNNVLQNINNNIPMQQGYPFQSGINNMPGVNKDGPNQALNPQNFTLNVSTGTMGSNGGQQNQQNQMTRQQPQFMQNPQMFGQGQQMQQQPQFLQNQNNADLSTLVDNLAYQRGYNLFQTTAQPKVDFSSPLQQQHGTDPNLVMQKLQQERNGLNGSNSAGALNLNELLGTQAPVAMQQQQLVATKTQNQIDPKMTSQDPKFQNYVQQLQQHRQKGDTLDKLLKEQEQQRYGKKPQQSSSTDTTVAPSSEQEPADLNQAYYARLNDINKRFNNKEEINEEPDNQLQNIPKFSNPFSHQTETKTFLSLDFRQDLKDIEENKYCIRFDEIKKISKIELVSCTLTRNEALDGEPYIYINIDEISGNYGLGNKLRLFGKLYPEKKVGNFLEYKPENCFKTFTTPINMYQMTVSFLKYNQKPISLHNLQIKKIIKQIAMNRLKILTKTPHFLTTDDEVNITIYEKNNIQVNSFTILEIIDDKTFVIDNIYDNISPNLSIDRKSIKCSLTFSVI